MLYILYISYIYIGNIKEKGRPDASAHFRDCARTTLVLVNISYDIKFSQLWNYTNQACPTDGALYVPHSPS